MAEEGVNVLEKLTEGKLTPTKYTQELISNQCEKLISHAHEAPPTFALENIWSL